MIKNIITYGAYLIIAFILAQLIQSLYIYLIKEKLIKNAIEQGIDKTEINHFSRKRIEKFLRSRGCEGQISVTQYIYIKLGFGLAVCAITFSIWNIYIAFIGLIVGFFLLDVMIEYSNYIDNKKLVGDIIKIYDTLNIQISSGTYITKALRGVYRRVSGKRLKKALDELSADISATHDINESLEKFRRKFKSSHIDNLCRTIRQGVETDQMKNILRDNSHTLKNMVSDKQREDSKIIEYKVLGIQFFILILSTVTVMYGLFNQITSSITKF